MSFFLSTFLIVSAQSWDRSNVAIYEDYDKLAETFQPEGDTIHVINFWATWCKPCVAELPYFETFYENNKTTRPLKMTLVSLDFEKHIDSKLIPFLNDAEIKSQVVLLTDSRMNAYIDKVDPSWEGSIPATLILYPKDRKFFEQEFHSVLELENIIYN